MIFSKPNLKGVKDMSDSNIVEMSNMWDQRYSTQDWPTDPNDSLVELVKDLKPAKALDLGCGTGRHCIYLAKLGWTVTGVDSSKVGLEIAQNNSKKLNLTIETIHSDLLTFVPKASFYDLVILSYIHFKQENLKKIIGIALDSLKENGLIYAVMHHKSDLGKTGPPDPELLFETKDFEIFPDLKIKTLSEVRRDFEDGTFNTDVLLIAEK